MDLFLLQAVASESAGLLVGRELQRVACLGHSRYLLRFATPSRDNLLISVRPELPRFHLLPRGTRALEGPPDRFTALLDHELGGAVLRRLDAQRWDRVVEMRFDLPPRHDAATRRRLVIELFGRSANVMLLDAAGTVLGHARAIKSTYRAAAAGTAYQPPIRHPDYEDLPAGPAALAAIAARRADPATFLRPLSPALADDLKAMAPAGAAAIRARLEQIFEAAGAGAWEPVVYSSRPLAQFTEGDAPAKTDLIVAPLTLRSPLHDRHAVEDTVYEKRFGSPSEAAAVGFGLAERLRDFVALREHHRAQVRKEISRLTTLAGKLEAELEAARSCDRFRRFGEALLAGLRTARVMGHEAEVADPRDPEGTSLRVPIDPARSLQDNAQALFARYKKGKRGRATVETRLAAVRDRLRQWREMEPLAARVQSQEDLAGLRESMGRLGLVHAPRDRKVRPGARAPAAPARVRRHISPDGLVILVGRSGDENDTLTFSVATPTDFWLHAAGHPGAHVVVRNPQRLKTLPEATLRLAAGIAAFYSGARGESGAEVHYTQRKHVHKRRGMPRGQVLLRRFKSIRVAPRLPGSTLRDV
jgi:predicted ribosome quality control (RQC) complex YloA/Tae2 family protein